MIIHPDLLSDTTELLDDLFDYMDNRADADYDSERGYIANTEVVLASQIDSIRTKLRSPQP
jgi:hypothetical protein